MICFDEKHAQLFYYPGYGELYKDSRSFTAVFICLLIHAEVFLKATDGFAIDLEQDENC